MNRMLKTVVLAGAALPMGALCFANEAEAQDGTGIVIINEWNAVGPGAFLQEGYDPFFDSGKVLGNGTDWIELVVIQDEADLRGLKINWANSDPDSGTLTLTNDALWNGLEAGTIITIRTDGSCFKSNVTYDPCGAGQDWHIDINAFDTQYVTQTGDNFETDNDNWEVEIRTAGNVLVQDWVGEQGDIWSGTGLGNDEVGKLEDDPSVDAAKPVSVGIANYNDGDCSSYGQPNCWNNGDDRQDFSTLRGAACP